MTNDDFRPTPSYLLPFSLLAISSAALLIFQIVNINKQYKTMIETKQQFTSAISQREALVKQSGELQAKLQAMAIDLLELAKSNEKAKTIVQKYNIQQQANAAAGAAAPATPAATTPAATPEQK